jgi:hypothetical protein
VGQPLAYSRKSSNAPSSVAARCSGGIVRARSATFVEKLFHAFF